MRDIRLYILVSLLLAGATRAAASPLTVSVTSLDFGEIGVGTLSDPITVTVTAGPSAVVISAIVSGDIAFYVDDAKTSRRLPAGGTTTFDVSFTPAVIGRATTSILVQIEGMQGAAASLDASGFGVGKPQAVFGITTRACSTDGRGTGSAELLAVGVAAALMFRGMRRRKTRSGLGVRHRLRDARWRLFAGIFLIPAKPAAADTPPISLSQSDIDFGPVVVEAASDPALVGIKGGALDVRIASILSSDPAFVVDDSLTERWVSTTTKTSFMVLFVPTALGQRAATITVYVWGRAQPAATLKVSGVGVESLPGAHHVKGACTTTGTRDYSAAMVLGVIGILVLGNRRWRRRRAATDPARRDDARDAA